MPLIVGLGNPGASYDGTPHNVGFEVLARLARRAGIRFRRSRVGEAEEAAFPGFDRTILLRPLSFMNLSGRPVSAALHWHRFQTSDLFVICDDVNLPPGYIRIRSSGGAGGQKGLISIIQAVGTDNIARLRIGVGGGHPGADVASHVLARIPAALRNTMDEAVEAAADAVEYYLRSDLETAMNRFNTKRATDSSDNPAGGTCPPDDSSPKGD
jgi:peptidyl-tRNA hydrolase, PTH1 family